MLFNTFEYFLFLAVVLVVCLALLRSAPLRFYLAVLVVASLVFYGWWDPVYLPLLVGSVAFNFLVGRRLAAGALRPKPAQQAWLWFGIATNLALLGIFKYADFVIANINWVAGTSIPQPHIVLPLGISFFTFTQIAFLVDASRWQAKDYSPVSYSLFATYFPHLLAGPILHHAEMMPQFADSAAQRVRWDNVYAGLFLFAIGLSKKVAVADALAPYVNAGYAHTADLGCADAWITTVAYTFQLYFDFSGYTDMALGSALMLNIKLPINFNSPYAALSIQDFWRRWHMTLSRFLRDYVYVPLGGNRDGGWKLYRNLFLTFLLGGIWHGAGWTFVIWGCLHGAGICVHRAWTRLRVPMPAILAAAVTFLFVHIAWVYFRADSVQDANTVLRAMASPSLRSAESFIFPAFDYSPVVAGVIAVFMLVEAFRWNSMTWMPKGAPTVRHTFAIAVFLGGSLILMSHRHVTEFLYFQF